LGRSHDSEDFDYEAMPEYDAYEGPRSRKPKPKKVSGRLQDGVVVRARGHHYDVELISEGEQNAPRQIVMCEVRGRLLQERGRDTLVAVGDRVKVALIGSSKGQIDKVEDRHSVLSRQQPGSNMPAEDVILANPDQVLVVFAVAEPDPHLRMLDRFLVVAEANELPAIICANKIDLSLSVDAKALFQQYEEIGYRVVYTSTETGEGIDELRDLLVDQITVLTGPSGVGKSSLLNAIEPGLEIRVGDLRNYMQKGRHTTRSAALYPLQLGNTTYVADTPGIRELGLYEIASQALGFYFREFVPFIHLCKYPNCTHDHEPGCAVREAVEQGTIHPERYESYLRLLRGDE
jgi:ribosome biogenesis GTPase / thiamine phosphate phosphatase